MAGRDDVMCINVFHASMVSVGNDLLALEDVPYLLSDRFGNSLVDSVPVADRLCLPGS